jgi:hypothetical protein
MSSPDVVLYDSSGNMLAVQNGTAIPASTPALMIAGSDGTNSRYILIDGSGQTIVVGSGTAGSPAGGVVSIQGVSSGTAININGTVTSNIGTTGGLFLDSTFTSRINTLGQKTMAASTPVVVASDQSIIPVTQSSSSGSSSFINASVTNVNLLSINTNRRGATFYNESTSTLYLLLGTTASVTKYTVQIITNAYYEVPYGYTGNIDGIWTNTVGSVRITEIS